MTTKKYELTDERHPTITFLRRIRALTDAVPGVQVGDLGGWIKSEANLAQSGAAWVFGDARVSGDAQVFGDAQVSGGARVFGGAQVFGDAQVSGDAQVFGDAQVSGDALVFGDARVSGDAHCLTITGLPSGNATLTPDADGMPLLRVGCWTGTPDTLRDLIGGEEWPEARGDERDRRRPGLTALAALCDAQIAIWDLTGIGATDE